MRYIEGIYERQDRRLREIEAMRPTEPPEDKEDEDALLCDAVEEDTADGE